jgi:dihydroxyacetone kinase-like predicted kinase
MAEAAQKVVSLALARADRVETLPGLTIQVGDVLGLCNNHLCSVGQTEAEVVLALLAYLSLEQYELMTIYPGKEATPEQAAALTQVITDSYPSLQVECYAGGQTGYYYIMSLE